MHIQRLLVVLGPLLTFGFVYSGSLALAATPAFTIAATNVIMSSSTSNGTGTSTFKLSSINGYTGSVLVDCNPPTPPGGVKTPYCTYGASGIAPVPAQQPITLTANEAVTGTVTFYNAPVPCSNPCPVSLLRRGGHGPAPGLALAGVLLLGLGFRRRRARWLTLMLLAAGTMAGLAGISACGGNNNAVTPGTYAYTIVATDLNTSVSVTTSVNVTAP
jgi:hypothetical protein